MCPKQERWPRRTARKGRRTGSSFAAATDHSRRPARHKCAQCEGPSAAGPRTAVSLPSPGFDPASCPAYACCWSRGEAGVPGPPVRRAPRARLRARSTGRRARAGGARPALPPRRLRTASSGPVAARRGRHQGPAVRLPDVRPVRAVLDRHVLPDELPEGAAQRPLRGRPAGRVLRGQAVDALRLGAGLGRRDAHGGRRARSPPCCRRSTARSGARPPGCASRARRPRRGAPRARQRRTTIADAFPQARATEPATAPLAPEPAARGRARGPAMSDFEDIVRPYETPPPGHVSGSRLEQVLRSGPVRGDGRAEPARQRRPLRRLRGGAAAGRGGGRDQRDGRQRRQLPHVLDRHLGAADAGGLWHGLPDQLPRPEPHRHPGRRAGRRRDGGAQRALPDRRRGRRRRSAGRQSPSSTSTR